MFTEYSEDIYPYATFQLEESVPAGGDSRCNSAAPLQTFVYHDPRLSTADTLQLREVSSADVYHRSRAFAPLIRARLRYPHVFFCSFFCHPERFAMILYSCLWFRPLWLCFPKNEEQRSLLNSRFSRAHWLEVFVKVKTGKQNEGIHNLTKFRTREDPFAILYSESIWIVLAIYVTRSPLIDCTLTRSTINTEI